MKLTGRLRLLCAGFVCGACLAIGLFFGDALGRGANKSKSENVAIDQEEEIVFSKDSSKLNAIGRHMGTSIDGGNIYDLDPILSLEDEFVGSLRELVSVGEYDRAIEKAKERLSNLDELWEDKETRSGAKFRDSVHLLAVALELKGDFNEAFRVYSFLYSQRSELSDWFYVRRLYQEGNTEWAFRHICEIIAQRYAHYPIDKVLKTYCSDRETVAVQQGRDPVNFPSDWPLYQLRDQLAQIANPKLRYLAGNTETSERLEESDREALEEIKSFMEKEYSKLMDDPNQSSIEKERYANIMTFARKLYNLP